MAHVSPTLITTRQRRGSPFGVCAVATSTEPYASQVIVPWAGARSGTPGSRRRRNSAVPGSATADVWCGRDSSAEPAGQLNSTSEGDRACANCTMMPLAIAAASESGPQIPIPSRASTCTGASSMLAAASRIRSKAAAAMTSAPADGSPLSRRELATRPRPTHTRSSESRSERHRSGSCRLKPSTTPAAGVRDSRAAICRECSARMRSEGCLDVRGKPSAPLLGAAAARQASRRRGCSTPPAARARRIPARTPTA